MTGPLFRFSEVWQLVINTGTTIVTFLMIFLMQNTQNRDSEALHFKLDELLRATDKARDTLVDLEDMSDDEWQRFQEKFTRTRDRAEDAVSRASEATEGRQPSS